MKLEEEYLDQFNAIEFAIVDVFHKNPSLLDSEVDRALEHCVRHYKSKLMGRDAPEHKLTGLDLNIFESVMSQANGLINDEFTTEILIQCLKRLRKSINRWSGQGGIQGYLKFIDNYL